MEQIIAITGSTRGIGFYLAQEFLKQGHHVALNGTTKHSLNEAMNKLLNLGFHPVGWVGDVTSVNFPQQFFEFTVANFGKVDVWINNAGINQLTGKAWELDVNEIQHLISVNLTGVINCTNVVYRLMMEQGHGKIFNMEGLGSDGRIIDKTAIYGTSKRAVNYFTKAFAAECKDSSVQVGVLSPGMVVTDFILRPMEKNAPEDRKRTQKIFNLLGELPENVAAFLVPRILKSRKNYDRIEYLTKGRLIKKLVGALFHKQDYFADFNANYSNQ